MGLLTLHGQAPYELAFRWLYRPPIPAGLAPEARRAMIEQRVREIFDEGLPPEQVIDVPADRIERPIWDVDLAAARRRWRRQRQHAASEEERSEAPSGALAGH
jgi:hypothetical protein